jgi:hypothetical protein
VTHLELHSRKILLPQQQVVLLVAKCNHEEHRGSDLLERLAINLATHLANLPRVVPSRLASLPAIVPAFPPSPCRLSQHAPPNLERTPIRSDTTGYSRLLC